MENVLVQEPKHVPSVTAKVDRAVGYLYNTPELLRKLFQPFHLLCVGLVVFDLRKPVLVKCLLVLLVIFVHRHFKRSIPRV